MTVHAIAKITVTDPDKIAAYREKAADALAKHGGAVLQASGELTTLEGEAPLPNIVAILSFPDRDAAHAWKNDPTLAATHALRTGSGTSDIVLL